MERMKTRLLTLSLILLVLIVSACGSSGGEDIELPTRVTVADAFDVAGDPLTEISAIAEDGLTPVTAPDSNLPATWTLTPTTSLTVTVAPSETPSVTPSLTITNTPRPTDTLTPIDTLAPVGIGGIAQLIPFVTPVPTGFASGDTVGALIPTLPPGQPTAVVLPTVTPSNGSILATQPPASVCQFLPSGGFGQIILNNPNLPNEIGCAVGSPPVTSSVSAAVQEFERGRMLWVNTTPGVIYVFYNTGTFQRFDDTYDPNVDPEGGGETPPAGLIEPVRGFGKVWRTFTGVRDGLGWALTDESGTSAVIQNFSSGRMVYVSPRSDTFVIIHQGNPEIGSWRSLQGTF